MESTPLSHQLRHHITLGARDLHGLSWNELTINVQVISYNFQILYIFYF